MYHLVLLSAAMALLGSTCKSATINRQMKLLHEMNNHIDSNERSTPKRFLNLTRKPPARVLLGRTSEITCEAVGTPAPSIRWFRDNAPIYEYDKESHEISDSNPQSLARVSSTVLLSGGADARYTCVAISGHLTARAHTIVYNAGVTERTERSRLVPLAPRILRHARVLADPIGSITRLPCAARGHPRPSVRWTDAEGRPVTDNPRMKVLRSGELVISPLEWGDMGELTCTATNMFGSTHVNTFLYPAKPSESDG
ncbi:neural/ectodermal development factor IMP-L2-like [Aricia agestis]|uniref:neural/ectodermal development factor IMP-L2-like n=1 Tax=Aricia agestis TaxID=91739 RepID=UPI001C206887|nr:neural/ectodermal development factor IMP-L2-like [Aricia agestis]XP_041985804.1 neural/ectodermal development factor IMP-L2-like [Aricia agestis]